jgi:hypothetical protein
VFLYGKDFNAYLVNAKLDANFSIIVADYPPAPPPATPLRLAPEETTPYPLIGAALAFFLVVGALYWRLCFRKPERKKD